MPESKEVATVSKKKHWNLTPHPVRSCWRKKRGGHTYYVGKGTERFSEAEYKVAWAEWEKMLADIEQKEKEFAQTIYRSELNNLGLGSYIPEHTAAARSEASERSIEKIVRKFLDHKKRQAQTEQKSVGRYANLESYLSDFVEFMGKDVDTMRINTSTVPEYYDRQIEQLDDELIGDYYARDRMAAMKQFIRWACELDFCNRPKTLDSKDYTIAVTVGEVEPMPIQCLQSRITAATGRLKLELLLMANCGFTQVDIGDLLHSEMNWQAGTITRKRSKKQKGKEQNLPSVTWTLWPTTLQLLREQATTNSPNVLATKQGKKTTSDGFSESGKAVRTDATGQSYRKFEADLIAKQNAELLPKLTNEQQLKLADAQVLELDDKQLKFRRWSPKHIRKTSSTEISNSRDFSRFTQYFLGQAAVTVVDKHYAKPSAELFKDCCKWLGIHLELDTMEKISEAVQ